ncbi:MAG: hypothetical protein AAGA70_15245 [Pseudomonadota bacterium]
MNLAFHDEIAFRPTRSVSTFVEKSLHHDNEWSVFDPEPPCETEDKFNQAPADYAPEPIFVWDF